MTGLIFLPLSNGDLCGNNAPIGTFQRLEGVKPRRAFSRRLFSQSWRITIQQLRLLPRATLPSYYTFGRHYLECTTLNGAHSL